MTPARKLVVALVIAAPLVFAAVGASADPTVAAPSPAATTATPSTGPTSPAPSTPPTTAPADPFPTTPTAPPAGAGQDNLGGKSHPGFFDIGGRITKAINDWFSGLVNDALNPVLDLVGRTVLSTPDFTGPGRVHDLWFMSWGIANAVFVLLIVAAGAIAMGYETFQTSYAIKDLLPRLGFGWVVANASLELSHLAIGAADALSRAFVGEGASGPGALATTHQLVVGAMAGGGIFVTLIGLAVVVLAIGLVGIYVVRVCTMVVLVAAAPLFLVGHALPQTQGAARLWWRAMIGCLAVQVGQALVLVTAVRVFFDADGRRSLGLPGGPLMDLLVVGCLFWLMLRLPSYARRMVFNTRPNHAFTAAKTYVVTQGLRAAKAAAVA